MERQKELDTVQLDICDIRPKKINSLSQLPARIAFKIRFSA